MFLCARHSRCSASSRFKKRFNVYFLSHYTHLFNHPLDRLDRATVIPVQLMSHQLTLQQSVTAGSLSGLVSGFTLQPFEVLRTKSIGLKGASSLDIARTITATQGLAGFWRGTTASLWRQVPGIALFYTIIESSPSSTRSERLQTGFIARTTATTLLLPLVVIKRTKRINHENALCCHASHNNLIS